VDGGETEVEALNPYAFSVEGVKIDLTLLDPTKDSMRGYRGRLLPLRRLTIAFPPTRPSFPPFLPSFRFNRTSYGKKANLAPPSPFPTTMIYPVEVNFTAGLVRATSAISIASITTLRARSTSEGKPSSSHPPSLPPSLFPSLPPFLPLTFPPSRMKDVAQQQYSQGEAEYAAGMTKEVLPPAHSAGREGGREGGVWSRYRDNREWAASWIACGYERREGVRGKDSAQVTDFDKFSTTFC